MESGWSLARGLLAGDGFWLVCEFAKQILDQESNPFYGTRIAKVTPE